MPSRVASILPSFVAILLWNSCPAPAAEPEEAFQEWLFHRVEDHDFESLKTIYRMKQIVEDSIKLGEKKFAETLWLRAFEKTRRGKPGTNHFYLVEMADKIDRLDLAESVIKIGEGLEDKLKDDIDIIRYRRGDKDALKNFPRTKKGKMTFYDAMELANLYTQNGDYKAVEELVTDLEITPENDPEDVAGLAFLKIAQILRDKGEQEKAIEWVDKAFAVAGRQFYTGYCIETVHRSMHGKLTQDLDQYVQRGLAYRGHMAEELLQGVTRELIVTDHYKEAKFVASHLEKKEDRRNVSTGIVRRLCTLGKVSDALDGINELEESLERNVARVAVAKTLFQKGKPDAAAKLARFAESQFRKMTDDDFKDSAAQLANLYGSLRDRESVARLIADSSDDPTKQAGVLAAAFRGYAESVTTEKPEPK